ncbi:ABC transporter permease [Akkermansia muciniphila]|nr:ABC transporter permease [Akkermansia muciniphila]
MRNSGEIGGAGEGDKEDEYSGISDTHTRINLNETGEQVVVVRQDKDSGSVKDAFFSGTPSRKAASEGWTVDIESPMDRAERWARRMRQTDNTEAVRDKAQGYAWRAVMYKTSFDGLLQGTMGNSFKYNEPVWDMIKERIPVSLYFGILSAIITYSVCIPLGVVKAIRHKSLVDNISSVLIFLGYSVPGFALGAVLVVYLGARLEWFPLCGLTSPDFADMGFWQQAGDLLHHTVLPPDLLCSKFLCHHHHDDEKQPDGQSFRGLHQDSHGQGREFQRAVIKHAFRNSFIPIASTLGSLISLIVAGSMLVEKVFDIQGFGMLSYQALMDKDYALIMGTLLLTSFLMVLGNLLSDIIVAAVDPRIKFE